MSDVFLKRIRRHLHTKGIKLQPKSQINSLAINLVEMINHLRDHNINFGFEKNHGVHGISSSYKLPLFRVDLLIALANEIK